MSKKAKKAITAEEQLQMDIQLETDLSRFMKQVKKFERESGGKGDAKMAKQMRVARILEKEQNNIKTDLFVATCSTKKKEDAHVTANLLSLMHERDYFDGEIMEKKAHLQEIDAQICMLKKLVITARTTVVPDRELQEKVLAGQKIMEGLENKLGTATKRFCAIQTENRKLRQEIDHLLLERRNFNKLWDRLIANLDKGKKFMIDIIEQSTIAYNQREEIVTKLNALRFRAHNDLLMHGEEMVRLQQHIDDCGKLSEFLETKGQKRVMKDLERREYVKRIQKSEERRNYLFDCKKIFADILEFSGLDDVEDFYFQYTAQEEENFGTFSYITVLHTEIEQFTEELMKLHSYIDAQTKLNSERAQHQKDNIIKLREELSHATKQADHTQSRLDHTNYELRDIYKGVDKLVKIVKCVNAPVLELLGDNTSINNYNILLHLNILENKISELILDVYHSQKSLRKKGHAGHSGHAGHAHTGLLDEEQVVRPVYLIEQIIPTNPCPLCVDQELVTCVIDTLQFVQSREEVKAKLAQRLTLPDAIERLHNVSACHLPKSRQIMQRRYQ